MGTKREETLPGAIGCWAKAGMDEPLFILRAQDKFAPSIVRDWADRAEEAGANPAKVREARSLANRMEAWARDHGGAKVPD